MEEHGVQESQEHTARAEADQAHLVYTGQTREYGQRQVGADLGSLVVPY